MYNICTYFIVLLLLHLQGLQRAYFYTSFAITACRHIFFFSFIPNRTFAKGETRALGDMAMISSLTRVQTASRLSCSRHTKAKRRFWFSRTQYHPDLSTRIHRFVRVYYWTLDNIAVKPNLGRLFGLSNITIIIF